MSVSHRAPMKGDVRAALTRRRGPYLAAAFVSAVFCFPLASTGAASTRSSQRTPLWAVDGASLTIPMLVDLKPGALTTVVLTNRSEAGKRATRIARDKGLAILTVPQTSAHKSC